MATHLSTLAWKIPWMEATVHGVAKSQTRLSNFTFLSFLHLFGLLYFWFVLSFVQYFSAFFFFNVIIFEVSFSQASRIVEFFSWRRLNSFFLLVSALISLVQWFVWDSYRVRFVLSFCLFVFPPMCKAEWGGNPVCWRLCLYFCFVCCLDEASCTGCYWWLRDVKSCIQVISFILVLTIWYSVGLILWKSRVLESVLPLQRLRAWSLSKDQPRSNLPREISPEMKGSFLEFQKPVHKNTMEISDSVETQYSLTHGQVSMDCLNSTSWWKELQSHGAKDAGRYREMWRIMDNSEKKKKKKEYDRN